MICTTAPRQHDLPPCSARRAAAHRFRRRDGRRHPDPCPGGAGPPSELTARRWHGRAADRASASRNIGNRAQRHNETVRIFSFRRNLALPGARLSDPRVPPPGHRCVRLGYVWNEAARSTKRPKAPCIRSGNALAPHARHPRDPSVRATETPKSRRHAPQHARGRSPTPTELMRVRYAHARPPGWSPGCLPGGHRVPSAAARAAGATRAAARGCPPRPRSAVCCAGAARGVHRPSSQAQTCARE